MSHEREFERLLEPAAWGGDVLGKEAHAAARDVGDTLYMCAAWWRQYGGDMKPTSADLLKMCELMLQREHELKDARQRREQLEDM